MIRKPCQWIGVMLVTALLSAGMGSLSAQASEPADSAIANVVADLDRFEAQLGSSPSKATINRTLKLLTLTRQRLDGSSNQGHPSWQEADARLTALVERLQSPTPAASPAAAPVQQPAATAPAQAPPAAQPAQQPAQQLISQDVARLKKLLRDIQSASSTVDQGGVKPFQDPAYVEKYQNAADNYRAQLQRYAAFADNPQVQACAQALQQLDNMLAFGRQEGAKALAELGDVQARLAALRQRIGQNSPPAMPDPPSADTLEAWINRLGEIQTQSRADAQELAEIKQAAYLPLTRGTVEQGAAYDMQNVDSMLSWLNSNLRDIEQNLTQLASNLDAQMRHSGDTLSYFEGLDPEDPQDRANAFLGAGQLDENLTRIDAEIGRIEAAMAFDRRMQRDSLEDREDLLERAREVREDYIGAREEALELSVMPEEATDDDDLMEIAEEVLANPRYEVGEIERIVINADLSEHSKESSEVEFDDVDVSLSGEVTLSGTQTTTFYEWEQFQVATAEAVGDKYYIYYNTLRHFTSGATTTPLNRWILSNRFQGPEILEDNIDPGWF